MRNRFRKRDKTIFFFMILLIVILMLGIGYAILQDTLSFFHNTKDIEYSNLNIVFTDYKTSGDGLINVEIDKNNPSRTSFSISDLKGYNETSIIEYTIKNEEDYPIELNIIKSSINNQSYFSLESNINELNKTTIQPKEEKKLSIKVKVTKVSTEKSNITAEAKIIVRGIKKEK